MENLRRIIIPWTDNGYNFNFQIPDAVHSYVVIITNVVRNSPAEAAGLRNGDGVVSINGNLLRNLSKPEIHSLINNFRNTALKLTVLQNFLNCDQLDKRVDDLSCPKDQMTNDISAHLIPEKISGSNGDANLKKEKSNPPSKRKFTKYSRNMSDVTHNSRCFHHRVWEDKSNRRSSSPLKENNSTNNNLSKPMVSCNVHHHCNHHHHLHATILDSSSAANNNLQLNRVGGIMRIPLPSNAINNHLFRTQSEKHETLRRKNQLTYLTCSPIPYRSGRIVDPSEIQERRSLPEQSVRESIYKQMSIDNLEPKSSVSETNKTVGEQDLTSKFEGNRGTNETNIDPVPVRIMWKWTNNREVCHPFWQHSIISVENGLFRVKENDSDDSCSHCPLNNDNNDSQNSSDLSKPSNMSDPTEDRPSDASKFIYNFSYFDSQQRKWEFLVEFNNKRVSSNWLQFFDNPKQKETRKYSRTLQSHILNPAVNSVGPTTETIAASTNKSESASSKGKLHHALNRVRNFTQRRLNSNDSSSEFKRQQEEWLMKTEPHFASVSESEECRDMTVNICTDHLGYLGDRVQIPHLATLPLDKWQRSVTSPFIPLVVEICVKVIEKFGIHHVGIYRVSANKLSLDAINCELRRPLNDIDLTSEVWNDIYALSGVLKSFLRSLPDGVFPKDYYFEIINAWKMYEKDREKRLLSVQRLLNILESVPDHPEYRYHWSTLRYLASHLFLVSSKSSVNKMTAKNLAVVFAPTLIKPPTETNEILMNDYRYRIELVENIITHHEWMFSPGFESACNVPPEIDQETTLLSEMQFESFTEDQVEEDRISENQEDARVLITEIIENVKNVSPNLPNTETDHHIQYTLIELNSTKENREKQLETPTKNALEMGRSFEDSSIDNSPEISETPVSKEKKPKRMSFKLSKSKHNKSNFPRDQLLLTNKKLCALSIALITSNRCPLNSSVILENDSPKITVE